MPRAPAIIAVVNLAVLAFHGWAHQALGVALSPGQAAIVYGLIVPGPLIALLLFSRYPFLANIILLISMGVGFVFGGLFHYVIASPDHVAHLPAGEGHVVFQRSAAALAIAEALGIVAAIAALRRLAPPQGRIREGPQLHDGIGRHTPPGT